MVGSTPRLPRAPHSHRARGAERSPPRDRAQPRRTSRSLWRPLYLALTLYSTRGVQVGQGYLFKWPAALNEVFTSLHGMGQLTAGEPSEPTSDRPTGTSRRSRRRREQRFLKAVELHAMAAAASWYTAQGYAVDDVSARKSWDLEVTRDGEVRRIEVKGSAGVRDAVDLTANEVLNATDWSPCDLFVVDRIELVDDSGVVRTGGGRSRLWADWTPAPDALQPVAYSHLLPLDPEQLHVPTSIEHVEATLPGPGMPPETQRL